MQIVDRELTTVSVLHISHTSHVTPAVILRSVQATNICLSENLRELCVGRRVAREQRACGDGERLTLEVGHNTARLPYK